MTTPTPDDRRTVADATCLACGLLCDDIDLTVEAGRVVEAAHACPLGRSWFLADHRREGLPDATIDGRPATVDEAIDRAADLLRSAKAPLVAGLTGEPVEAQALAATLADRLGAAIDPGHAREAAPRVAAVQRVGATVASFGEVKNRADVIVLWDVDPTVTHPRFRERLVDPPGRFVPGGRSGRSVLVVDGGESEARSWADAALAVAPGRHAKVLRLIRALVLGIAADPGRVERACGLSVDALTAWAERLKAARYGAFAFGSSLADEGAGAVEALFRLIDDLNRSTRCVTLPLAGPGNPSGAEAVLTARLGAPLAIDLADGTPRHRPGDADGRADRGETDAVLDVAEPSRCRPLKTSAPVVRLSPVATALGGPGVVAIATATAGIDAGGSVVRSDEVTLPLRPPLEPSRPEAAAVLRALLDRLAPIGGTADGD